MDKIFNILGILSSILGVVWTSVKLYNFFVKPKQELKFFCNVISVFDRSDKLYYKYDPEQYYNYKLALEVTRQTEYKGEIEKKKTIEDCKSLYVYEIGIKNTGKKNINSSDFYQADKLSLKLDRDTIAISISEKTPKYINASVLNFTEKEAIIAFDSIEPSDCIYISLISLGKVYSSNLISGKTNYIKRIKALDTKTAEICYGSLDFFEKELLRIKEGFKQIISSSLFWPILNIIVLLFFIMLLIISEINK